MRKSTVIAIAIIVFGAISMLVLFRSYTEQFIEEIHNAKELTDEFRSALEKDTKIRLYRARGAREYVVKDPAAFGLLVDASPDASAWKRDPSGFRFAHEVAVKAFDLYGTDRPIRWVEFRLVRLDGTRVPSIALERGEGTSVVPVESTAPK